MPDPLAEALVLLWFVAIVCSPVLSLAATYFVVGPLLDSGWQRVASALAIGLVLTPVFLAWTYFLPFTFWMAIPYVFLVRFISRRRAVRPA